MFSVKNPVYYWTLTIVTSLLEIVVPFLSFEKFSGKKKRGKLDGYGTQSFWVFDEHFEGTWNDGKMNGKGKHWFGPKSKSPGEEYIGYFVNDLKQGKGTLKLSDGQVYKGDFHEDKYHGKGECSFPNGDTYKGDFSKNLHHGYGVYTFADGRVESRKYVDGNFVG